MAKKNPESSENIDHNKKALDDWENHHDLGDRYPEEAKGIGETEVKNANAAGDGAMENMNELDDFESDGNRNKKPQEPPY
ncbi:MAG TPA: hypothetical protein VFL47_14835 [Flavisolibacter sp.]|nr:hypothetical protein [Flavisolibacter sp.]